jgi:hypothetical protein
MTKTPARVAVSSCMQCHSGQCRSYPYTCRPPRRHVTCIAMRGGDAEEEGCASMVRPDLPLPPAVMACTHTRVGMLP